MSLSRSGTEPAAGYGRPQDGHLYIGEQIADHMTDEVHSAFRAFLHDPDFPCLGAKSLVNQLSYRFGLYQKLGEPESTLRLANDLYEFIRERPSIEGEFSSFIACFVEPKILTPKQFEIQLWQQLLALHEHDSPEHDWAPDVSRDPASPEFSFSFGGHAFFIVGLSPGSERWARRFPWPVLVFNAHAQFERLKQELRFDRLRETIRERDEHLHGSANEMLEDYGTHSEARQYAGRKVGPKWRCPVEFHGGSQDDDR